MGPDKGTIGVEDSNVQITTAEDWMSSNVPRAMLEALWDCGVLGMINRELRLFACSCVRQVGRLLEDPRSWNAVEVAERYAEGSAGPEELREAHEEAKAAEHSVNLRIRTLNLERQRSGEDLGPEEWRVWEIGHDHPLGRLLNAAHSAVAASGDVRVTNLSTRKVSESGPYFAAVGGSIYSHDSVASGEELAARKALWLADEESNHYEDAWQADRLRCVLGDPRRPWSFDRSGVSATAIRLAHEIDDAQVFHQIPALADALEAGGCDDEPLIAHCRTGEHGRGCWALDLIHGNERRWGLVAFPS